MAVAAFVLLFLGEAFGHGEQRNQRETVEARRRPFVDEEDDAALLVDQGQITAGLQIDFEGKAAQPAARRLHVHECLEDIGNAAGGVDALLPTGQGMPAHAHAGRSFKDGNHECVPPGLGDGHQESGIRSQGSGVTDTSRPLSPDP